MHQTGEQRKIRYEGLAAIEKSLSDPRYVLHRRPSFMGAGRKLTLEEAFRIAQQGREALLYADPVC